MSKILEQDFEEVISVFPEINMLKGSTIFVTGATGFLGSLLVKALDYYNKKLFLQLNILALIRNQEKADDILKGCNVRFLKGDLCNLPPIDIPVDYIFHCAAVTKSKEMIESPVEVIAGIVNGTQNILKLAYDKQITSMVYLSSMEVYGLTDASFKVTKERDLGYIDIQNVRSCYPLGKRIAENLCYSYYKEYHTPVKIARLAQTFGAGILNDETRVFSQFARSVIRKNNIVLHTDGSSTGNYCYTADAILALFILLLKGQDGEIYNVANEDTCMTIRQMAELVADKIADKNISVIYDASVADQYGYAVPVNMKLSSEKLRELGWGPKYNMEQMYQRMIAYMNENI